MKRVLFTYTLLFGLILFFGCKTDTDQDKISKSDIASAEKLIGLSFSESERDTMLDDLTSQKKNLQEIRSWELQNSTAPAISFNPKPGWLQINKSQKKNKWIVPTNIQRPEKDSDLAFMPVAELAYLIQSGQVTSVELTKIYLDRLKTYGDTLHCVITLTEDLAMQQAKKADEDLEKGIYHGPLHGIPYGLKDLLVVEGYKTTWGAEPYKSQELKGSATVYERLRDHGAILVAKLSMGALAMGDIWYKDTTRNPWDLQQGSSGSSAGSASATSAGLVGFSIGTETYGSIVSPSTRCGVTGLRPTFGRVSRAGAMALSWTMDKIGPICRSANGCAMVFDAIYGPDNIDRTVTDYPFHYDATKNVQELKVAYLKELFQEDYPGKENDSLTLDKLREMGIEMKPVKLPSEVPVSPLLTILNAESAAAFDALTRSGKDDQLVQQHSNAWPNIFRTARFIPAAEYINANRIRTLLIDNLNQWMKDYDVVVTPSFGGNQLLMTNLTGHPCVVVPNGFDEDNHPTSISFIGNLYDEGTLLEFAHHYQSQTSHDDQKPPLFTE